jgi:hypothetical protein
MPLNEGLEFTSAASNEVQRAFTMRPPVVKILLPAGTRLYKWTEYPLFTGKGITPWWSPVDSIVLPDGTLMEGFRVYQERAERLEVTHREFSRIRSAVTRQWNTMSRLLWIELTEAVYGFAGSVFGQLEDQGVDNVFLIGGSYQLWIPNLTAAHVREIPALG